ncbi:unnamed protein product [Psylliodes chrysocephalus]|uniref:Uncharacterized protein n=1 Tax=Psylliodes chrysocephalus TaxID=3402493 RepID=A0A9P0CWC9_9CUCU|nr:unnamed protein product [Psylliodes chrysocephala]
MGEEGFCVSGVQCQQKFMNLSKKYINFQRHVHQTGVERKEPPQFYDDLDKILGNKDKVTLDNIMDSMEFSKEPPKFDESQSEICEEKPPVLKVKSVKKNDIETIYGNKSYNFGDNPRL